MPYFVLLFTIIAIAAGVCLAIGLTCPRSLARHCLREAGGWAMRLFGVEEK